MASLDGQYFTEGNTTAMRMTKFFQQSIFSPVLVEAGLAFFAGFLFSAATIGSIPSPIPIAIAGSLSPLGSISVLVGMLLMDLFTGTLLEHLVFLFALVLLASVQMFRTQTQSGVRIAWQTGLCVFAATIAAAALSDLSGYQVLANTTAACMTGTAAYFVHTVLNGFRTNGKIQLKSSMGCAAAVVYILAIATLGSFDFPTMNPGRIAGIAVTLLAARKYKHTGGVVCGALTTCGVMLCNNTVGLPLLFLPITGLLAGYLASMPGIAFAAIFAALNLLAQITFGVQELEFSVFSDMLLGCIAFLLLQPVCLEKWIVASWGEDRTALQSVDTRLQFLADSIGSVREDTKAISTILKNQQRCKEDPVRLSDTICKSCKHRLHCWEKEYETTRAAFQQLGSRRNLQLSTIPKELQHCTRKNQLVAVFEQARRERKTQQLIAEKLEENRTILFEQLQATEELVSSIGSKMAVRYSGEITDMVLRKLEHYGYYCDSVVAYYNAQNRLMIELYCQYQGLDHCMPTICHILSETLNVTLQELDPIKNESSMRYRIAQCSTYRLETACAALTAEVGQPSGDTSVSFQDGSGTAYIVISDGMGSGSQAALESKMLTELFRKLISSGMSCHAAIRMLNGLMLTKSDQETFATLDVAAIDLDTCQLHMMKSGASATLLRHNGMVRKISAPTFPIGMQPVSEVQETDLDFCANDILIMLSDGVSEATYQFIKQLLLSSNDLEYIVKEICSKSDLFAGGQHYDDVTVYGVRAVLSEY